MVEAADILNIDAPDLYVRQSPVPNAYTLAISGKKPFVVIHTSLVELLTRKELQVVNLFDFIALPHILNCYPYFVTSQPRFSADQFCFWKLTLICNFIRNIERN